MEGFLKVSTAVNITVMILSNVDHVTGKTGLSAGLTIYATKAAGTPAAITPVVTELDATNAKGLYKLALTTAHTNTVGELQLHITGAGADQADFKWQVSTYLPGEAATLQVNERVSVADAMLDESAGVESGTTVREALRLFLAVLCGKVSGAATTTVSIRDSNDTKNRVVATVDADGNRSAVTLDAT